MPKPLTAFEKLAARLDGKDLAVEVLPDGGGIVVSPSIFEQFQVRVHVRGSKYVVGFEGWEKTFDDEEAAIACAIWGLSPACRLEVLHRGDVPVRWMTQSLQGNHWVDGSTKSRFFSPFWRQKTLVYKQNRVFDQIEGTFGASA